MIALKIIVSIVSHLPPPDIRCPDVDLVIHSTTTGNTIIVNPRTDICE